MTTVIERPMPSFRVLRAAAQNNPLIRGLTETRTMQVAHHEWDIGLTSSAGSETGKRRDEARAWFRGPSADHYPMHEWLRVVTREILVTDALALWKHQPRTPGHGLLGSDVVSLDILDGATILPDVDTAGGSLHRYHLYADPVARVSAAALRAGQGASHAGALRAVATPRQLMYLPYTRRSWTPFGFSPVEQAISQGDGCSDEALAAAFCFGFTAPWELKEIEAAGDPATRTMDARLRGWLKAILDQFLHETCRAPDLEWLWLAPAEGLEPPPS